MEVVDLNVWGSLGAQFLCLLLRTIDSGPPAMTPEYPLDGLDDAKLANVYANSATLLHAAPSPCADGRMLDHVDAQSFFAFLRRNSSPCAYIPASCFSKDELELLIERSWLPVGASGARLKTRLQQLTAATLNLRDAVSAITNEPQAERRAWRSGVIATDDDIDNALLSCGLPCRKMQRLC
jgi:hypothetical protein